MWQRGMQYLMGSTSAFLPESGSVAAHLLALLLMAVALLIRLAMAPLDAGLQYVTFFPAVTLAAILGGFWPGLLATLVGMVLATYMFHPPFLEFSAFKFQQNLWPNLVFLADGLIVCSSIEAMHRYRLQHVSELAQVHRNAERVAVANEALRRSEAFAISVFDSRSQQVVVLDGDGIIMAVNESWRRFAARHGGAVADPMGSSYQEVCVRMPCCPEGEEAGRVDQGIGAVLAGSQDEFSHKYFRDTNDGRLCFQVRATPLRGERRGAVVAHENITEQQRAEEELRIAATVFEAQEGMMVADANDIILRVNRAFTVNTGYSAQEAVGRHVRFLKSGRHDPAFYAAMWDAIRREGSWQGEIWNRRKNGEVYPEWLTITAVRNRAGEVSHYVATHTDITARKAAEDEIRDMAFRDPLTRLPNRRLLMDRLHQALLASSRLEREGALMFIDLDNFKTLNDTLGHDKGDLLLQQVAQRLSGCVRDGDTVARLGGDEFVIILELLSGEVREAAQQARQVGDKILASLGQTYFLAGHEFRTTPSIGVALFGRRGISPDALLQEADAAMYQAKKAGRNTLRMSGAGGNC